MAVEAEDILTRIRINRVEAVARRLSVAERTVRAVEAVDVMPELDVETFLLTGVMSLERG
jgi:hypothetical protein